MLMPILFSFEPDYSLLNQELMLYKNDDKGPFQTVRWFLPDGTNRPANTSSPIIGSYQRATYKPFIIDLQTRYHLFLAPILSGIDPVIFVDERNDFSRIKQYQLNQFLIAIDDGWILRKAQYMRGSYQIEDEHFFGKQICLYLLIQPNLIEPHYFFIRQAISDIPHQNNQLTMESIRVLSSKIAEVNPLFMPIRTKIHNIPSPSDKNLVESFIRQNQSSLTSGNLSDLSELSKQIETIYLSTDIISTDNLKQLLKNPSLREIADKINFKNFESLSNLSIVIRKSILDKNVSSVEKLILIDLSLSVENALIKQSNIKRQLSTRGIFESAYYLVQAMAGCGYIEMWEWEAIRKELVAPPIPEKMNLDDYIRLTGTYRRILDWGSQMYSVYYQNEVNQYSKFEPLSQKFIDHKIRSSILFPLGRSVIKMNQFLAKQNISNNTIPLLKNGSLVFGLNPGFASGTLKTITNSNDSQQIGSKDILLIRQPPEDMPPVRGIISVSDGNAVSHVQLLAKNLGIPNASITEEQFYELSHHTGESVFLAVSPGGRVILKLTVYMTTTENALFVQQPSKQGKLTIPINRLNLRNLKLASLKELSLNDAGRICGPKAANLGNLSNLFPGRVSPGFIIPFGVFRNQLGKMLPGENISFWNYLGETFQSGFSEETILKRLNYLQAAIQKEELAEALKIKLEEMFIQEFDSPVGATGVFIRSDTNVEDLKDFTGAGLNLTIPNAVTRDSIFSAIQNVWGSPYSQRSYRWRQLVLNNPQHVYPSILIMKSVSSEKSGVLITETLYKDYPDGITVAVNRGIGGAVAGQSAETWLVLPDRAILMAPSRQRNYYSLKPPGGLQRKPTVLNEPIITSSDITQLRQFVSEIESKKKQLSGLQLQAPFDIEFGFENQNLRLFQIRSFVKNKKALTHPFLINIDAIPIMNKPLTIK
ncbi:MAG: hypothetical protein A2Y40_04460 [Candidatus Margulisbacteria bacterium GWF2_35_9]|nr:MAG: hypothetical protein A2Y40_04460 [Candidatus Margulisbacteria bacterium GWF2_35_9]